MALEDMYVDSFDDYGVIVTPAASGGLRRTDVAVQKDIPCRIEDAGSRQEMRGDALAIVTKNRIFTAYTALQNGHTIRFIDPLTGENAVARVTDTNNRRPIGSMDGFVVVGAEWVKN